MPARIQTFEYTARFKRDYKALDAVQQRAVDACLVELCADPIPESRRFHLLNPKRAGIYSADVLRGATTYKLTLTLAGAHATFRRVDTHKAIDRSP